MATGQVSVATYTRVRRQGENRPFDNQPLRGLRNLATTVGKLFSLFPPCSSWKGGAGRAAAAWTVATALSWLWPCTERRIRRARRPARPVGGPPLPGVPEAPPLPSARPLAIRAAAGALLRGWQQVRPGRARGRASLLIFVIATLLSRAHRQVRRYIHAPVCA